MASYGMKYIPNFMTISPGIQVILRLLPHHWDVVILVLLIEGSYVIRYWDGFMWHDIPTKFHENLCRCSSDIKFFFSAVWTSVMLVLLMGGIYEAHRWGGIRCHDMLIKFHKYCFRQSQIHIQTHKEEGDLTSLFLFFQNKESRLRNANTWTLRLSLGLVAITNELLESDLWKFYGGILEL
jgi:hypothetical protein